MEWVFLIVALVAVAVLCLQLNSVSRWLGTGLLVLLGLTLLGAKVWYDQQTAHRERTEVHERSIPSEGRPGGYVSSQTCQSCHPHEHASWHMSYHRTMTQYASPESVRGDFDHGTLEHLATPITVSREADEYWVEMDDPDWVAKKVANPGRYPAHLKAPRVKRRIGMLTGSHHMQVYWVPSESGNLQHLFPYSYLFEDERWVPFKSTFLRDPAIPDATQLWNMNCISCHATAGQPLPNYQTRTLATRSGEMGIACEACHGPAEAHVAHYQNPLNRYQADRGDAIDDTIVNPAKLDAQRSSMVCGQCHGISWISDSRDYHQNGFRYRPGALLDQNRKPIRATRLEDQPYLKQPLEQNPRYLSDRFWSDGMVRVSGREYSGMMESECHLNGDLSCLSCHDMHHDRPKSEAALAWRDDQLASAGKGNQACVQCHESIGNSIEAHTHHAADSAGSHCYNCHMPHTTYGLLKAIRSHHIDSPSVWNSLETGRPNACNLCHLDQTLEWSARHLTEWFGQETPTLTEEQRSTAASLLWLIKGEAGQRALLAWHFGWEPAKQASGDAWMGFALAQGLVDPYSAVRYISQRSLKQLDGYEDLDYDFIGPTAERQKSVQWARSVWASARVERQAASTDRAEVLLSDEGRIDLARFQQLIDTRDNRSMDLQE